MPPFRLAVLGDPLTYTRSPELHRAGLAALGLEGESSALPTPAARLVDRLAELVSAGYTGVNLTHPLKEAVLARLDRVSSAAARARSVNTVGFSGGTMWGDTTDGDGFVDLLRSRGRDPAREVVLMLGGGGAARSLTLALVAGGARVTVSVRDPQAAESWGETAGVAVVAWRGAEESRALESATLVVNATPVSSASEPIPPHLIPDGARAVDLTYQPEPTPWVAACRARGLDAEDGLGLLVHQGRRSLALWFGREVPLEPLARAVGWSR